MSKPGMFRKNTKEEGIEGLDTEGEIRLERGRASSIDGILPLFAKPCFLVQAEAVLLDFIRHMGLRMSNGLGRAMTMKKTSIGIAIGIGIVIFYTALTAGYYAAVHYWAKDEKGTSFEGTFGDAFGGFNAYFTGLAFIGVIATLLLQSKQVQMQAEELRLQREELKDTREELKRSADAQEKTKDALASQVRVSALAADITATLSRTRELGAHIYTSYNGLLKDDPTNWTIDKLDARIPTFVPEYFDGYFKKELAALKFELEELRILKQEINNQHTALRKLSS